MSNAKKWGVAFVAALAVAIAAVAYPRGAAMPESAGPIDKDGKLRLFDDLGTFRNTDSIRISSQSTSSYFGNKSLYSLAFVS
jgi:hypothetical protein